jgi:predicted nucleic acid-binding protein
MLLYLDTSALVKLYVQEAYSEVVNELQQRADVIASHQIAFVEFHAAIARRQRENDLDAPTFEALKQAFVEDWVDYLQVETDLSLLQSAAELAEVFSLRAYDSVHLAAARHLHQQAPLPLLFACFDKRLNLAAKVLGMQSIQITT